MAVSTRLFPTCGTVSSVPFLLVFLFNLNLLSTSLATRKEAVAIASSQTRTENEDIILTEIRLLKETNARQEETIVMLERKVRNHEERVIHLEKFQFSKNSLIINRKDDDGTFNENVVREKRPVRLLPISLFMKKRANKVDNESQRMPSSCADLNEIGHTLSAFYIVKEKEGNSSKLQTIFCDFQILDSSANRESNSTMLEKRIGFLSMKSSASGISFYVQRNNTKPTKGPIVRYNLHRLNLEGAMNGSTGIFTVPKPGVYHFDFLGFKHSSLDQLVIYLRVNGVNQASSFSAFGPIPGSIAIHSTLKLKIGDKVDVFIGKGTLAGCASNECVHFNGWLLEDDLPVIF